MDTKQIIILLIIGGIYIFNTIRKLKIKQDQSNIPDDIPSEEDQFEEDFEPKYRETIGSDYESLLVKNIQNYAESLESTSLEGESLESISFDFNEHRILNTEPQISDNEIDNIIEISTDTDDLRKGFIYGEILKKRYN